MADAVVAVLVFAVAASAIVFAVDGLNCLRRQRIISKRLDILARSDW